MSDNSGKSSERVAAGLKATLHNPNTGAEAKERALNRLNDMGVQVEEREPIKAAKDEAEFGAPNVLGSDPQDDEYEFKPVTADERDEDLE
ncbi:hypothetical protein EV361DRAFT_888928 [Lentinula raphanica]|nr:hypothetical protein EV361DRAFT_888928 [Lentinula raphanica]